LLQTLINCFIVENRTCPELRDRLIEELEMWADKSAELDVGSPPGMGQDGTTDVGWSRRNSWG